MKHFRISDKIVFSVGNGEVVIEEERLTNFGPQIEMTTKELEDLINVYQQHKWVAGNDTNAA